MNTYKNKIISGLIIIISGFVLLGYNYTRNKKISKSLITLADSSSCMPDSEFQLGSVKLSYHIDSIKQKLGEPDSITNEIDTQSEIWHYKQIDIGLINNHIYYMGSKDTITSTPSGIKIGLTKAEVSKILIGQNSDIFNITPEATNVQIVNCDTEYYMIFDFVSTELVKLEMGIDLP
ncbi:MAG: hypothetical protein JEZ03_04300 [Bacteroidales bacterium]|nr:hypothetical protein [Bacteroidales bacterium]